MTVKPDPARPDRNPTDRDGSAQRERDAEGGRRSQDHGEAPSMDEADRANGEPGAQQEP